MAKKTVLLRALARIDYNGGTYIPGTEEDTFECDPAEAKRLKELQVAVTVTAEPLPETKPGAAELEAQKQAELEAQANADLLARIAAATTREDLEALIPAEEPSDPDFAIELRAAFTARVAEFEA